jgi:hypothetical protein
MLEEKTNICLGIIVSSLGETHFGLVAEGSEYLRTFAITFEMFSMHA